MPIFLENRQKRFPLKLGMNILGRQKSGDIKIPDPFVSRRHLSIDVLGDETLTLMDLGSSNGLFVNGTKVPNAVLSPGESFVIGKTSLKINRE